jgi:hypothetical protein
LGQIEVLDGRNTFIQFTSPSRNLTGSIELPVQIVISIENGLGNVTTAQQYNKEADKLMSTILGNFTGTSQDSTLSGLPAVSRTIAVNHPMSGIELFIAQIFALKNGNAYTITYTAPSPVYSNYLPIVEHVLNSFQITD